jgi:anthranilate phosphoribosyltransferase
MSATLASTTGPARGYGGFRATIRAVGTGRRGARSLAFEEAREAMRALLSGETSDAQAGAFLVAVRIKGEEPEELAGMAQALRDAASSREPVRSTRPVIACAGGYDGVQRSPQLSLATAALAAACGVDCVMHCGDPLGPKFGTVPADVLDALGGPRRPSVQQSRAMLQHSGVALVHAGEAIRGWDRLARLRDEIGLRGPVHSAEKLVDHLGARRFVVGYTHHAYGARIVEALRLLGAEDAVALRSLEATDVLRPGRPQVHTSGPMLELPERLGVRLDERSYSASDSARLTLAILEPGGDLPTGSEGAAAWAVLLSAALRVWLAGLVDTIERGIERAHNARAGGDGLRTLQALLGA